jgi:hypothetical protein
MKADGGMVEHMVMNELIKHHAMKNHGEGEV